MLSSIAANNNDNLRHLEKCSAFVENDILFRALSPESGTVLLSAEDERTDGRTDGIGRCEKKKKTATWGLVGWVIHRHLPGALCG